MGFFYYNAHVFLFPFSFVICCLWAVTFTQPLSVKSPCWLLLRFFFFANDAACIQAGKHALAAFRLSEAQQCFALQRKENTRRGGEWGGHECAFTLGRKSCLTPGNQISSPLVWAVYTFACYLSYTQHHQVGVTAALSCLGIEGRETIRAGVCPQERDNKTWHKRFEQSLTCKHMPERCIGGLADLHIPRLVAPHSPPPLV